MTLILQVSQNINLKYNIIQLKLNDEGISNWTTV